VVDRLQGGDEDAAGWDGSLRPERGPVRADRRVRADDGRHDDPGGAQHHRLPGPATPLHGGRDPHRHSAGTGYGWKVMGDEARSPAPKTQHLSPNTFSEGELIRGSDGQP